MTCDEVEERDLLDRYIQGTLTDEERDAFEQHYLGCVVCAAGVETMLHLRQALQEKPRRRSPIPLWAAAAAGLLVVALIAVWLTRDEPTARTDIAEQSPPPAPALSAPADDPLLELAQVAPPAYEETVLRSAGGDLFRKAMRLYFEGRYAEAIPGLRQAATKDPAASEVWFYLGACHLLEGETEPAIEALRHVTANPDSPFSEEARFYLAKALIRARRLEDARSELSALASGDGPWAADARELLGRLPSE